MSTQLRADLGALLDQYDETRRVALARSDQAAADGTIYLAQFAELRRAVVRPVFEAVGAMLAERGHRFSVEEEEFAEPGAGKAPRQAAIVLRVTPAGMEESTPANDDDKRSLSFTTRHYNKTVSIRNGAVPYEGSGAKSGLTIERITTQLVEEEVLKLMAVLVRG
jgi:hypothetical protein